MLELIVNTEGIDVALQFEHSLLAVSKWESKHKKPYSTSLMNDPSALIDYFKDMLLTPDVDPNLVYALRPADLEALTNYINDSQTASFVPEDGPFKPNHETITSELIYYWLVAFEIPFQPTETWHLNRLMMLVRMTGFKRQPPKKQHTAHLMEKIASMNEARKAKFNTTG